MAVHCAVLMLFSLFLTVASQTGFTSIDCGGTRAFLSQRNITWVTDEGYVSTGLNANITGTNLATTLETLRYFSNATDSNNCYHLPVIPNRRYLLRATYYYGSYDGKSVWPVFQTYVDGNSWSEIAGEDNFYSYTKESIWTSNGTRLRLCLQSSDDENVPFISALETRLLPNGSYSSLGLANMPLYRLRRWNLGAESFFRYPYDPYDRYWYTPISSYTMINTTKTVPSTSLLLDNPPHMVFSSALEGPEDMSPLNFTTDIVSSTGQLYIGLFFWDFRERSINDSCMFQVSIQINGATINGSQLIYSLASQPRGYHVHLYTLLSNFALSISILPLSNSTLPPLLNAIEIYEVGYHTTLSSSSPSVSPSPSPIPSALVSSPSPSPSPSPSSLLSPTSPASPIKSTSTHHSPGLMLFILFILKALCYILLNVY